MEIVPRRLSGVFEIRLHPHHDERGFFMRTFDARAFREAGLHREWIQENHSRSDRKGVLRGLHFQFPPFCEAKLVRCVRGAILDVFLDLRSDSETYGQWDSAELSESSWNAILIPRGFAHGFCTLTDAAEVLYKVDNRYSPEHEGGILWNDPDLRIDWPERNPVLSSKDGRNMTFAEFSSRYKGLRP